MYIEVVRASHIYLRAGGTDVNSFSVLRSPVEHVIVDSTISDGVADDLGVGNKVLQPYTLAPVSVSVKDSKPSTIGENALFVRWPHDSFLLLCAVTSPRGHNIVHGTSANVRHH